jgi:orotate phosphoribosyltransferase
MSIDPNNHTIDKVIKDLQLSDTEPGGVRPHKMLQQSIAAHEGIWKEIDERIYTVHGLHHSLRIIDCFLPFFARYSISDYEKVVFAVAAFVHDIGMQYNSWAPLPVRTPNDRHHEYIWQVLKTPRPPLTSDKVRLQHVHLGAALVQAEFEGHSSWVQPQQWSTGGADEINLLSHAHLVGFSHSTDEYWKYFLQQSPETGDQKVKGLTTAYHLYRPRILAGLMRLCDELEGTYARVPSPERIWAQDLPNFSKLHWLSCFFVQNLEISLEESHLKIDIHWRVPAGSTKDMREQIRQLLRFMRLTKITATNNDVNAMYCACNQEQHCLSIKVTGLDRDPIPFQFSEVGRLGKLLTRADKLLKNTTTDRSIRAHIAPSPSALAQKRRSSQTFENSILPQINTPLPKDPGNALREWLSAHREFRHVALDNGLHTNTYVQCRSLASDQTIVRYLTEILYRKYATQNIGVVVGVGTSAITLAVNVALRFGADVTFTFNDEGPKREKRYFVERRPIVRANNNQNVLVIDDIIAAGQVANQVIHQLRTLKVLPSQIKHVSLFRLGTKEIKKISGTTYDYLCHVKDVYYETPSKCKYCRSNDPWIQERDI